MYLILRLRSEGGGKGKEIALAAGDKIEQVIALDTKDFKDWEPSRTTVFKVQILNSSAYRKVTGEEPPPSSLDAARYAEHGYPFFKHYEEPSEVHENFAQVKFVAEIENRTEEHVSPKIVPTFDAGTNTVIAPVGLMNPAGPLQPFRTAHCLDNELCKMAEGTGKVKKERSD